MVSNVSYRKRKLMVIDPVEKSRNELCKFLYKLGFSVDSVLCVETPDDAIELLKELDFDLVFVEITDEIRMDATDGGYGLISLIRNHDNDTTIPVLFTANIGNQFSGLGPLKALSVKAQGYLRRPFNYVTIKKHVDISLRMHDLDRKLDNIINKNFNEMLIMNQQCLSDCGECNV